MRLRTFLFVSVLALASPVVAQPDASSDVPCVGFTEVDGIGPACPAPGGWRMLLADGTTLLTHGPDPKPSEGAPGLGQNSTTSYPPWPPACAPTTQKHIFLVYMVASDGVDRYATYQGKLRDMVNRMNGHLRLEAQLLGDEMSYRFACDADGQVHVERVISSVPSSNRGDGTFSSLVNDLRSKGFTSSNAKYLVHWDASHCCYGGVGNVHNDDRLVAGNANNGGPDYAINYGNTDGWGIMTMSHEIGHNIGAVQLSSPQSSGGWHCNDGQDTMCYADDASTSNYSGSVCTDREHYDCNHDDYFHPTPAPGSYLATHWNLASRLNVWFDFSPRANQRPVVSSIWCYEEPSSPGDEASCGVMADDPDIHFNNGGGNLTYTFDWGDDTPPTTLGPYTSIYGVTGQHTWAQAGDYTVTVTATDDGVPALTSLPRSVAHRVECNFLGTGQLLVGLTGVETPYSARTYAIPPCAGQSYTLTSTGINDFDACWYDGATLLHCDTQPGNNLGVVPTGATHAHIVFMTGAQGFYRFTIGS